MGLDIMQSFDIEEQDPNLDLFKEEDNDKYYLSRTFCDFMVRKEVIEEEADLDQIGRLFDIDISPLYKMLEFTPSIEMEELLEFGLEDDPEGYRIKIKKDNDKISGNLESVLETLKTLIDQLEESSDISNEIVDHNDPTIPKSYYAKLDQPSEENYLNNNLSQDLRNLLRLSELAKSKGAETTFFVFC